MASDLFPVVTGIVRRRQWDEEASWIFAFVAFSLVIESASFLMAQSGINNLWLLNFYALCEYVILINIFAMWLGANGRKFLARALRASILVYFVFWLAAKIDFEPLLGSNQYTHSVSGLVFVAVALLTLIDLVRDEHGAVPFYATVRCWVSVGVLIFFSGNTVLFGLEGVISSLKLKDAVELWTYHWWLNIAANVCYGIGFLCLKKI